MNWTAIGVGAECECPNGTICYRPSKYAKPILCVNPQLANNFPGSIANQPISNEPQMAHTDVTLLAMTLIIILIQVLILWLLFLRLPAKTNHPRPRPPLPRELPVHIYSEPCISAPFERNPLTGRPSTSAWTGEMEEIELGEITPSEGTYV